MATEELSIGDYVLTGGELPAMVAIDAIVRLIPGVLGNADSAACDSFPTACWNIRNIPGRRTYRGWRVPEVLLSGHHAEIAKWRRQQSFRTMLRRPDLLDNASLTPMSDNGWTSSEDNWTEGKEIPIDTIPIAHYNGMKVFS